MIVRKQTHGYSSHRKYIQGKGFIDSLSSSIRSIGSYVGQNKDLIAKPLLGAVGNLAATGLEEGGKALLTHIINNKNKNKNSINNYVEPQLSAKSKEILQSIINSSNSNIPVTNIIGSGIKKF
jgi:hypothetical protein